MRATTAATAATTEDELPPRALRITSDDDVLLARYAEDIPIQSEPDSETMQQRREKILQTLIAGGMRSPSLHRRGDPTCSPLRLPLPPPNSPQLSTSPCSLAGSLLDDASSYLGESASQLLPVEDDVAWGEGLGVQSFAASPPPFLAAAAAAAAATSDRAAEFVVPISPLPRRAEPAEDPYATPYRSRSRAMAPTPGIPAPSPMIPIPPPSSAAGAAVSVATMPPPLPPLPLLTQQGRSQMPPTLTQMAQLGSGSAFASPRTPLPVPPLVMPPPQAPTPSLQAPSLSLSMMPPPPQPQPQPHSQPSSAGTLATPLSAARRASLVVSDFDWNTQFQKSMEAIGKLTLNTHADDRLAAYTKLSQLAADFSDTVKTYARIIISEVYLPPDQKTIKPVESLGGIAGGDKFVVQKILFKFALDTKGYYGGDENAARVANHDLKSLVHILNCWEPGVYFPMMALVDYRGFRVVGMTLLPINGDETLVYGSRDAGRTVRTQPLFEEKMRRIAAKLNLKAHFVGEEGHTFYTPVDLEGHIGHDGKMYVIDFSRLFPPQSLAPDHRLGHLYQLLRPEFVRSYRLPLCSDAFSTFACPNTSDQDRVKAAEESDREIDDATEFLVRSVVPEFAQRLCEVAPEKREQFELILLMHASGINVRYLGTLHEHVSKERCDYWDVRLVIEMAARVIKNEIRALLRRRMRELLAPGEGAYRSAVIAHLNLVFGNSTSSQRHWAASIVPRMAAVFPPFVFTGGSRASGMMRWIARSTQRLGVSDGRCALFKIVTHMLGLRFANTTWREITANPHYFDRLAPFTDTDLKEMREKVKELNIASHSAGFSLKTKAKMTSNPEERRRLLSLAVQQFQHALEGNPDNKVTLRNLGECFTSLGNLSAGQDCYLRALQAGPNDTTTLYKYAIALDKAGRLDEAEEYFLRSLEACPTHSNCCYSYADFLSSHRKNFADAERFYQRALEIDPSNKSAANNLAVFLATVRRDYEAAETYFVRATNASRSITHLTNYAAFLLFIRRNSDAANVYILRAHKLRVSSKWS